MTVWLFVGAAALLSLERICYVWIWRAPEAFGTVCAERLAWIGTPVDVLRNCFYAFKVLQGSVFLAWCYVFGRGVLWPPDGGAPYVWLGAGLIAAGQALNISVFYRLGPVGVFYGNRFGHAVPWCREFPFSFLQHPQYVGALLSIWGVFVMMRFPAPDWCVLPVVETVYYVIGARLER